MAWPLRALAWLIALPLGLVVVVVPARAFGLLSGQRLLDVLVGTGWGRYWRVLVIAPAWALVTTVVVQLVLYGLGKLGERRRAVRSERGDGGVSDGSGSRPRSRRRGGGRRRRRGPRT